ncbi:Tho complex subunit 7-domain-containing protein [Cladochytrium replicatum]|nr:Tho complex subunit 7-domain-containing protein [Cladochytrium replicatum]
MQQQDELIIRSRLQVEVRPLRKCIRRYHTLVYALSQPQPDLDYARQLYAAFLVDLEQFELTLGKFKGGEISCRREIGYYELERSRIASEVQDASEDIIRLKAELENAQRRRQNRIEYDALAKEINAIPSRQTSLDNIERLRGEIERLKQQQREHGGAVELRRKHLLAFVTGVQGIRHMLAETRDREEMAARQQFGDISEPVPIMVQTEEEEEGVLVEDEKNAMET